MTWCLLRVVGVVVDAEDDRQVGIRRRRGDDDLVGAGGQVLGRALAVGEEAGRLDDDVDLHVLPGQRGRVTLGQDAERVAVDRDLAVGDLDLLVELAVRRVVAKQVPEHVGRRQVVDRDDLEAGVLVQVCPVEVAPDPAETVDADPLRHVPPFSR